MVHGRGNAPGVTSGAPCLLYNNGSFYLKIRNLGTQRGEGATCPTRRRGSAFKPGWFTLLDLPLLESFFLLDYGLQCNANGFLLPQLEGEKKEVGPLTVGTDTIAVQTLSHVQFAA